MEEQVLRDLTTAIKELRTRLDLLLSKLETNDRKEELPNSAIDTLNKLTLTDVVKELRLEGISNIGPRLTTYVEILKDIDQWVPGRPDYLKKLQDCGITTKGIFTVEDFARAYCGGLLTFQSTLAANVGSRTFNLLVESLRKRDSELFKRF